MAHFSNERCNCKVICIGDKREITAKKFAPKAVGAASQ